MAEDSSKRNRISTIVAVLSVIAGGLLVLFVLAVLGVVPLTRGLYLGPLIWTAATGLLGLTRLRPVPVIVLSFMAGVAVLGLLIAMNFKAVRVEGQSMEPTLVPGDVLLVDLTEPPSARYGIYVLDVEGERHNPLIKRLVGLPGEEVDARYGRVFADKLEVYPRDGTPADTWNKERPAYARFYDRALELAEQEYFFLGDNPPDSRDSREFGPVQRDGVEGRVVWSLRGSHGFGHVD
ncbi:MAG: signal peptidase I [Planctomycetes bacterium]|nr:signal peptidase I [Planctomycetota bacterium]